MNLTLDERDELRTTVRSVLARSSSPDHVRAVAVDAEPGSLGFDPALWSQMVQLGWAAIHVDEAHGGAGCGWADLAVVLHELGRALTPSPFLASAVLATGALALAEAHDLAGPLLGRLAGGEATGTVALAAAGGSLDPACSTLSWRPAGGGIVLDGTAGLVLDADVADVVIAAAVDRDGRAAVVAVDRHAPGVRVTATPTVDATRRAFAVSFDAVALPDDRMLAAPGERAAELVGRVRSIGVVAAACDAVGATERALERAAAYARDRIQFGVPIGSFQAVKHHCADMAIAVAASRAAVAAAAAALDGDPAGWGSAAGITASYVGPACSDACARGLLVHGGIGFTWEEDSHLFLERVKLDEVLFGTPTWHRRHLADAVLPVAVAGADRSKEQPR